MLKLYVMIDKAKTKQVLVFAENAKEAKREMQKMEEKEND